MRSFSLLLFFLAATVSAAQPADIWGPVAQGVCQQIKTAHSLYQKNDVKNAHLDAIMAYFKGYDTELEPAVRITLGGQHVFEMERKFRDFAATMIPHPDKKQLQKVNDAATQLCEAMAEEAKALNVAKVKRQVFKVPS